MRIAVSGTHGSGKTTLIEDFVESHPGFKREDEPYWGLVQQGIPFADGASLPDLEEQLAASAELILAADQPAVIFDRCPIDFIAYCEVIGEAEGLDWAPSGKLLGRIERALAHLDVLVLVPLTSPDEIATRIELPRLRAKVDARLKSIVRDDSLGLLDGRRPKIIEVTGSRAARVRWLASLAT